MATSILRLLALSIFSVTLLSAQAINTIAGGGTGDGNAATQAFLNLPFGLAVDAAGNVYIADQNDHRIRKVDSRGLISTVAGTGVPGFGGDGASAMQAMFNSPALMRFAAGNLYIGDFANNRVRKIDASGNITTVAGNGSTGQGNENVTAVSNPLNTPVGVAIAANGDLYIADSNSQRILRVNSQGLISTFAGVFGSSGSTGDGGKAAAAKFSFPMGMTFDAAGNLLIADAGNGRIRKIDTAGNITTFAGGGTASVGTGVTATQARLYGPQDVVVGSDDYIYITDMSTAGISVIYRVTPDGSLLTRFAGAAAGVGYLDGVPATSSGLYNPAGLATDSAGRVYIADAGNHVVRRVGTDGRISTFAGGSVLDDGLATQAGLAAPNGVSVDGLGNILIADTANNRIRRMDTGNITTVAGNGLFGYSASDEGKPAKSVALFQPSGVVADNTGNIYIADTYNSRVRKVAPDGTITTIAGTGAFTYVAADDGGPANKARLNAPSALALDADGNLLIVDRGNRRIRKIVLSTGVITTIAGTSSSTLCSGGTSLSCGDGGPATAAYFGDPRDIARDGQGNVYVVDAPFNSQFGLIGGARIRRIDSSGTITTVAGNGQITAGGDNGLPTSAAIGIPSGIAIDRQGTIFIADENNHRIRRMVVGGTITTLAGGTAGFAGDGAPLSSAQFRRPQGMAISGGILFVVDSGNQRLRAIAGVAAQASRRLLMFSGNGQSAVVTVSLVQPLTVLVMEGLTAVQGVSVTFTTSSSTALTLSAAQVTTSASGQASVTVTAGMQPGDYTVTASVSGADPVTFNVRVLPYANQGGAINGAGYDRSVNALAPGVIASLFGNGMAGSLIVNAAATWPTRLGATEVRIKSGAQTLLAPLWFVSPTQINFMMPLEISATTASLTVVSNGIESVPITVNIAPTSPGIFTKDANGIGTGAIVHGDGSATVYTKPAARGEWMLIFCTGLGKVTNPPVSGSPASSEILSWVDMNTVSLTIGGVKLDAASIYFAGLAPGYTGLYQINAKVPETAPTGAAVPLLLTVGGSTANPVTIPIQ